MLASVGGLDSAAWRQGERNTYIDAVIIAAEENVAVRREVTHAMSTWASDLAQAFGRWRNGEGSASTQGGASTSNMSQQIQGAATDTTNSGHVGTTSTGEVASQTSTSAPPPAPLSDQVLSSSEATQITRVIAPSQPLSPTAEQRDEAAISSTSATMTQPQNGSPLAHASSSPATSNNTSAPLIWTEASTHSQPPHNASTSTSSSHTMAGESSSRALQPLSPNTRNSVPQRRAFVEDDDKGDENAGDGERTPKRQRGEGEVDADAGESSTGDEICCLERA